MVIGKGFFSSNIIIKKKTIQYHVENDTKNLNINILTKKNRIVKENKKQNITL